MKLHPLQENFPKPERFTFPFCYEPHPLCREAVNEVCRYIESNEIIRKDADKGKMFGVLVVEDTDGNTGFMAAYSGLLAGRNDWDFFVPPVFDSQQEGGYFKTHEAEITAINKDIAELSNNERLAGLKKKKETLKDEATRAIERHKAVAAEAKRKRDAKRNSKTELTDAELKEMTRESQFMKAELRRIKKHGEELISTVEEEIAAYEKRISELKRKRKAMSDTLQRWLFDRYIMLNARGERRNLCDIFACTPQGTPPAGAGDCCAPKLLQYAYLNNMRPVCMAEFWWGASPKTEIRRHLNYYPACSGKCKPILGFMMQGLDVDPDPQTVEHNGKLKIIYDDEWISVICKPSGMLSVPGKSSRESVYSIMKARYPRMTGPIIVHRLDMSTSGLMIIAKTKEIHERLQGQFERREIRKRYVALLEKPMPAGKGRITLPLAADPLDRPRQRVDYNNGKTAVTEYEITGQKDGHALIILHPHTGRTHQLRVHCAHTDGLDNPILGDSLYGHSASRLYLHAEAITFVHPALNKKMSFCADTEIFTPDI